MRKVLPVITAIGVVSSLSAAFYLGQINEFNFDQVLVQFCPQTANRNLSNAQESQATLDLKYCRYRHRLLKEVWQARQFKATIPLSDDSFFIQEFRGDKAAGFWLLLVPILAASSWLAWSNKCQLDYDEKFQKLEDLKTYFKLTTVSARNEREFKSTAIEQEWNNQRVKAGQLSIEAIQDNLAKQKEIRDRSHESTLKQFELNDSQADKDIAGNQLSAAEINKKIAKISGKVEEDRQQNVNTNEQLKTNLIDALKNHEDGWLWKIINNMKPLWLTGNQGSGKTYTASAIALVRNYCLDAPVYQLVDRHATGDNAEVWQYLKPVIKAESEEEIHQAFIDCCERWLERIKQKPTTKQQVIVDEFSNLQKLIGESATTFFELSLTDTRKAKEYLLGISHFSTNHSFAANTSDGRKAGTILLEKFSANNETPLPRIVVRYGLVDPQGNNLKDEERNMPDWFHPEKIYNHFNGTPINFEE